jgi:PAS domain-containing protein
LVNTVRTPIKIHAFPSDDAAFRWFAEEEMARIEAPDPVRLQRAIRVCYPLAVVRVRSAFARPPGDGDLWYVFRRAVSDPPAERWWMRQPAWVRLDRDRIILDASEAFATIVEIRRIDLLGRRIEELANPADPTAVEDVTALWGELVERGEVHGSLRFNRLDGSPRELEYHVAAEVASGDGYRAVIRER